VAAIDDPTFGDLRLFPDRGWECEVLFSPIGERITVCIDAPRSGPTASQRLLFKQIEQRWGDIFPEISRALADYVGQNWTFHLGSIEISAGDGSYNWTGQFTANLKDVDDMGYFVDLVNWRVAGISSAD